MWLERALFCTQQNPVWDHCMYKRNRTGIIYVVQMRWIWHANPTFMYSVSPATQTSYFLTSSHLRSQVGHKQDPKKAVVSETYEEVVFVDPRPEFYNRLRVHRPGGHGAANMIAPQ